MSSGLIVFRDHCRRMAEQCAGRIEHLRRRSREGDAATAARAMSERALWQQLASEIDAYLHGDPAVVLAPAPDDQPLWEETP